MPVILNELVYFRINKLVILLLPLSFLLALLPLITWLLILLPTFQHSINLQLNPFNFILHLFGPIIILLLYTFGYISAVLA